MRSKTLRLLLEKHHDVRVGPHSYGSLLVPGRADPKTRIGNYVSIGPDVRRLGAAHPMEATSMHPYWYHLKEGVAGHRTDVPRSPIEIGDDCWIGAGVIILPGCARIGVGAVVAAGSIVTKDVPDFAVVMGTPARVHSMRLSSRKREALIERDPFGLPPSECRRILDEIESMAD